VEEQIAISEGRKLRHAQLDIEFVGHAIECRINAEDWTHNFRPSPGAVTRAIFPVGQGIRIDTHMQAGATVPPYYDSLLGKLIVHGANRAEALQKAERALSNLEISGVSTNLAMHSELLRNVEFARGGANTAFLERFLQNRNAEIA
jgi:acetyl-CoA carboxylase, biotin carboxylase subunit